jgi:hypothetical protein
MTVLRVCYKHGVRFDEDYYISKHLPLATGVSNRSARLEERRDAKGDQDYGRVEAAVSSDFLCVL